MAGCFRKEIKAVAEDMSLLDNAMTDFVEIITTAMPDGLGGYIIEYAAGAPFKAAIRFDNSHAVRFCGRMVTG